MRREKGRPIHRKKHGLPEHPDLAVIVYKRNVTIQTGIACVCRKVEIVTQVLWNLIKRRCALKKIYRPFLFVAESALEVLARILDCGLVVARVVSINGKHFAV